MIKKIQIKILILCLLSLLWSTAAIAMLARAHRQKVQQHLHQRAQSIKTAEEINHHIESMQNNVSHECMQELAHITGQPYDAVKTNIDHARSSVKDVLKKSDHRAIHDPNMSQHLYTKLCTILHDEGVNPKSTSLEYKTDSQDSFLSADSRGTVFINGQHILTPRIRLYPPLLEESEEIQSFICRHEVWHVLLQHSFIHAQIFGLNADTKKLDSIKEREADIYAASRSSRLACAGAITRCSVGHAEIIDKDSHCVDMMIMCELMKRKEELS